MSKYSKFVSGKNKFFKTGTCGAYGICKSRRSKPKTLPLTKLYIPSSSRVPSGDSPSSLRHDKVNKHHKPNVRGTKLSYHTTYLDYKPPKIPKKPQLARHPTAMIGGLNTDWWTRAHTYTDRVNADFMKKNIIGQELTRHEAFWKAFPERFAFLIDAASLAIGGPQLVRSLGVGAFKILYRLAALRRAQAVAGGATQLKYVSFAAGKYPKAWAAFLKAVKKKRGVTHFTPKQRVELEHLFDVAVNKVAKTTKLPKNIPGAPIKPHGPTGRGLAALDEFGVPTYKLPKPSKGKFDWSKPPTESTRPKLKRFPHHNKL